MRMRTEPMQWYDVSLPIHTGMPTWPGDPPPEVRHLADLRRGDAANVSWIGLGVHTGTHIDAPAHFLAGGATVDALSLDDLVGPCTVAHVPVEALITATDLDALSLPSGVSRLLLKTANSSCRTERAAAQHPAAAASHRNCPSRGPVPEAFRRDFVSLAEDGARWIVERGLTLVGIDYLSVEAYQVPSDHSVHHTLLTAGVIVVEGLTLAKVPPGEYILVCLPLKLIGLEGAPARAILLPAGAVA